MALINPPPLKEEPGSPAWDQWFMQVYRGSGFLGSFSTANRPALRDLKPGQYGFDTSLGANGKPVFVDKNGTGWILADGTAA